MALPQQLLQGLSKSQIAGSHRGGNPVTVICGETMGRRVVMKGLIVKDAARPQRKTFLKFPLAEIVPRWLMQTGNHESSVVNAHPLNRSLIFVSRMIVRHPVWIDCGAFEKRRIVGTCDVCPNVFIKQDHTDAKRLDLGD